MISTAQGARIARKRLTGREYFSQLTSLAKKSAFGHLAPILAAITLGFFSLFAAPAMAQTNRATFPADFDQMVMYGDYLRTSFLNGQPSTRISQSI